MGYSDDDMNGGYGQVWQGSQDNISSHIPRVTWPPELSTSRVRGSTWTPRRTRGEGSLRSLRCHQTEERETMNEMKLSGLNAN